MKRAFPTDGSTLLVVVCLGVVPLAARPQSTSTSQEAALQKEVDDLKSEVGELRNELDQLKQTIHDLTAPRNPIFDINGAPVMGDEGAKVVMIEFSDYQCPYCMDYFTNIYRRVIADYVKTGKVRYVARDFPAKALTPMRCKPRRLRGAPPSRASSGRCTTACSQTKRTLDRPAYRTAQWLRGWT